MLTNHVAISYVHIYNTLAGLCVFTSRKLFFKQRVCESLRVIVVINSQHCIRSGLAQTAGCWVLLPVLLIWTWGLCQVEAVLNTGKARGPDTKETNGQEDDPLGCCCNEWECVFLRIHGSCSLPGPGVFVYVHEKRQVQDFVCVGLNMQ